MHAVIAVKSLAQAKSRLAEGLQPRDRPRLVLAMLTDTVTAAVATPGIASVTVVTPDSEVSRVVRGLGAQVEPEPSPNGHGSGLNAALAAGAAAVRRRHGAVELLALQADLPALRPRELADALGASTHRRSVVADHEGSGTVALLVRDGAAPLSPLFGPDSARRHIAAGAVELLGEWPGLRQDVDTTADLERAAALGVGVATGALLRELGVSRACHASKQVRRAGSSLC
ncbi:2-phospho-L-lactate guanylyltransferase [Nocardia huaxiensis]|uniref:Phosphoenolpyruvate guanylyltransferase n=1 Tax=Nocardia huaxiensis TaxID=2755382 RepID=A0A7D6V9E5_9NOCA|nr:2-phospho-L-lactate guanylyltransferase [Nocardia huaxiensis]QLY29974.1 2-phospho-L-lactate guanylyltransferase [Nocardia huaxiensis]UFS96440.1 2-phospho-L-lactate guanylyltransferase [Nocardia huaxiensis]